MSDDSTGAGVGLAEAEGGHSYAPGISTDDITGEKYTPNLATSGTRSTGGSGATPVIGGPTHSTHASSPGVEPRVKHASVA